LAAKWLQELDDVADRLTRKIAVITGAASGIGKASAFLFAAEAATVIVADLDVARGNRVCDSLRDLGHTADFVEVDVRDTGSVERMADTILQQHERIDVFFHNAMNCRLVNEQDRRVTELPEPVWSEIINLVLGGTYRCCKAIGRVMISQGSGSIILTATTDALIGTAGYDAYTAAKGGVVSLTRSLAAGLARDGIRVNAICPGFVATEPQLEWLKKDGAAEMMRILHLLPISKPENIASFALYLASEESSVVTGGIFPIDSGYMAFKANLDVSGMLGGGVKQ
jgi:NAD(P)-dependent dehydrogenase (short-subunit alcohol dehydrogenase family)